MHSTVKNSKDEKIKVLSPPTLVLTSYAPVSDITNKVTPDLKVANSYLIHVPFGHSYYNGRLGGSCYQQVTNTVGKTYIDNNKSTKLSTPPNLDNVTYFTNVFNIIQYFITKKYILSCHDISDGGLLITILEMAFTGNKGLDLDVSSELMAEQFWFSEELGVVIEVNKNYDVNDIIIHLEQANITYKIIGMSTDENIVEITYNEQLIINKSMTELRYQWEKTSFALEKYQTKYNTLVQEEELSKYRNNIEYFITPDIKSKLNNLHIQENTENTETTMYRPKVAILREVGSNGQREMISAFYQAGFEVSEITVQDLIDGSENLENYRGLVLVGGFSYGDVPAAGIGWATVLTQNYTVKKQLDRFKQRKNTFSLGICNGCQVMSHIGWVEGDFSLQTNESGRFESRWGMVKIPKNNSIFLSKLEGCILGIWVAHGEGRFVFENNSLNNKYICCQYVNINGRPTLHYPENPNGSVGGIAGLTSKDGRHLVMMPHPERSFLDWQMPYQDAEYIKEKKIKKWDYTPWFVMFKNAYEWCCSN
jgi:phosphoribosylformylglycinamidine synthase